MLLVFISNYFNHHQKPVCDAFYELLNHSFFFIETTEITEWRRKMGYKELEAPYTIKYNNQSKEQVLNLVNEADVVITDAEFLDITKERYGNRKLTFRCSERLFKSRLRYLKAPIHALKAWKTRHMYMLCSSAFTARDYNLMGFYRGKSYRWGYFPQLIKYDDVNELILSKQESSILWVGRLIDWKHPEASIEVARILKDKNIKFTLNIIGTGEMESMLSALVDSYGLNDCVNILGPKTPDEVRKYMEKSEIFLFTSDEGEGWGAVLNEAMNSGCAVVASDKIGATPYLIDNCNNGYSFISGNWSDLSAKVEVLLKNKEKRIRLSEQAIATISDVWNANNAARNFLSLVESLLKGEKDFLIEGPASKI